MNRVSLINDILVLFSSYYHYLEIGCHNGACFENINAGYKVGIEPDKSKTSGTLAITSDEFFRINKLKFDLVFIDGLHLKEQVERDVTNALKFLNKNGIIILHDCNPSSEERQHVPQISDGWNGDVWKCVVNLRSWPILDVHVVDADQGLGIVRRCRNTSQLRRIQYKDMDYALLEAHRKDLLRLITPKEAIEMLEAWSDNRWE